MLYYDSDGRCDQREHHNVVDGESDEARVVHAVDLRVACLVAQVEAEYERYALEAEAHGHPDELMLAAADLDLGLVDDFVGLAGLARQLHGLLLQRIMQSPDSQQNQIDEHHG